MSSSKQIFINPSAHSFELPSKSPIPATNVVEFHSTLSDYAQTSLIPLPSLAKSLKVGNLLIKDERSRFNLPSFKPLGVAWAIRNALIAELSEGLSEPIPGDITLADLATEAKEAQIKLVTATDGKLGRIVARLGKTFGVESINTRIFVSEDLDEKVKASIKAEGAEVITVGGDFEVAIREAWLHSVSTDGILVNIDAEENYEDIPKWIVEGYSTIFHEFDEQTSSSPDVIFLPVGVGGLAQAAVTHYKSASKNPHQTRIITVEAADSACLLQSLQAGKQLSIQPKDSILTHLNYEKVSDAAWEILQSGVDGSLGVHDEDVLAAVKELRDHGFDAGNCSGAVLAGLKLILGNEDRETLGIGEQSTIVLVCTDGPDA